MKKDEATMRKAAGRGASLTFTFSTALGVSDMVARTTKLFQQATALLAFRGPFSYCVIALYY
ncbi:unnamed protein product, partial [Boreogadus saida]